MGWWKNRKKLQRRHLRVAEDTRYLIPSTEIPDDPDVAYRCVSAVVKSRGLRLRKKAPNGTKWSRLSTYLPWCEIALDSAWDDYPTWFKAATLFHELVHAGPRKAVFFARYANAKWRVAYETQAYRMNVRCRKRWGAPRHELELYIDKLAARMVSTYKLGRLDRRSTMEHIRRILRKEL